MSTEEQDKRIGRVSSTHRQGRAFDLSLRPEHGWNENKIRLLKNSIEQNYKHLGAISYKSMTSRPIVVHSSKDKDGNSIGFDHAHIQVRPF